jgi:hypothetical protein
MASKNWVALEDDVLVVLVNKNKFLYLSFGAFIFVLGGIWMIKGGDSSGWGAVTFFGLCLLFSLYMLVPGTIRLIVDKSGVEIKQPLKITKLLWADIDSFYVKGIPSGSSSTKFIGIKISPNCNRLGTELPVPSVSSASEIVLPNHFSIPAGELIVILQEFKRRWVEGTQGSPEHCSGQQT